MRRNLNIHVVWFRLFVFGAEVRRGQRAKRGTDARQQIHWQHDQRVIEMNARVNRVKAE